MRKINTGKKNICLCLAIFFISLSPVFAQKKTILVPEVGNKSWNEASSDCPPLLSGIWSNSSRFVIFDTDYFTDENVNIPQIVLRLYFTWYDDRAAESEKYSEKYKREINSDTAKSKAEELQIKFIPLTQSDQKSGAWDILIKYPNRKETYHVPVAVIEDNLYLNFLISDTSFFPTPDYVNEGQILELSDNINSFWRDWGLSKGILISPSVQKKELTCLYFSNEALYKIRYWPCTLDFDSNAKANLIDENINAELPKHLKLADTVYTCTLGRRTLIRNTKRETNEAKNEFLKKAVYNETLLPQTKETENGSVNYFIKTSTILCLSSPYLSRLADTRTMQEIVESDNSRRVPDRKPLFPPHGILDFDWSIIEDPPEDWNRRMLDLGK